MCGLVGVAGAELDFKHERAFKELLIVDTIRGPHSTGIMCAGNNGGVNVFKKPLLPNDLFTMQGCKELFLYSNHALIGHNRWATQGAINGVNAHPFEFKSLVGAHNGTLIDQKLLPDHMDFEVDSENIFHSIEKIGLKETVARLNGAYALTWYDKGNRSINMIRNKERPLFVTFTEDRTVMFWASEAWMLVGVLAKNGIKHRDIYDTDIHTHYEFKIPVAEFKKPESSIISKPIQNKMAPWVAPQLPKPQTTVVKGNFSKTSGGTGKTNTATGSTRKNEWDYELGEQAYFYLDPSSPKNANWIYGLLAYDQTKRIKIYAPKDSWLRSNILADVDMDSQMYEAVVNGYCKEGIITQANSVYSIAMDEEEDESLSTQKIDQNIADAKEMNQDERLCQIKALQSTGGTCSWCGDPITPNKEHTYINTSTIICEDCKKNDVDAKELIKTY